MALRLAMLVMAATLSTNTAKAAEPTTQEDAAPATTKHRLIVLTDVGADPDDTQSLVCLMLYP